MRTQARVLVGGAALALAVWLLAGPGSAGDGKDQVWKPVVPKAEYKELVDRITRQIQDNLNGKSDEAPRRASANALILAAYTQIAKDGDKQELAALREAALNLIATLKKEGKLEEAKKLAAGFAGLKANPNAKTDPLDAPHKLVEELGDIMIYFKKKKEGGEGLPEALQTNVKLKGALNGVEEKIRELARKPLKADRLKTEADELALMAYKTEAIGGLVHFYAPPRKEGMKDPRDWREFGANMREAAAELAVAAKKGNPDEVHKAATRLNTSCTQCHGIFRVINN